MRKEKKKESGWGKNFLIILVFFVSIGPVETIAGSESPLILQRIKGNVKLDGFSDEPAWQGIQTLPLVMNSPEFGKEPSERTEILIAYDNDYLYAAGRFYDSEPKKIQAATKKRDGISGSNDQFAIIIDTFNDKENALGFITYPSGARLDIAIFNDARADGGLPYNSSWNTFWDTAVIKNDEGWFAEMRIPFSSLRFQDKEGRVVMGIIAWRWLARKSETIVFPGISPEFGDMSVFKPSQAKEFLLEDIHGKNPIYLTPYLLGGYGQSFELNDAGTNYQQHNNPVYEAGLDIKYGLTSNMTLDVTINTDFAQVEADDQQVNLTRFSLFFPEKRLFFQERSSIFEFNFGGPNRLFYSRRIGLHEEESVRIYGGIRLIGRVGSWDLGLMSMQTAAIEDLPSENFSILRARRRVFNPYSYVGGMITSRIGFDGSYNIAYGLDGIIRLFGDDYLSLNWAQTFENDAGNRFASWDSARTRVNWERRNVKGFAYNLSYNRSGPGYRPGVGFEARDDFTRFGDYIRFGWIPGRDSRLLNHGVSLNGSVYLKNQDMSIESAEIGPGYDFTTKSGYYGEIFLKQYYENVIDGFSFTEGDKNDPDVPAGTYTFYGVNAFLMSPTGKRLFILTNFYTGTFYDAWRTSAGVNAKWSISSSFELSGTYQIDHIKFTDRDKLFTAHIARFRVLTMPTSKFSASAFFQYNSTIETIIANIRLRYNFREGSDLYLVYNEGLHTNRYRKAPTLPFTSDRTIMLKYTYTFQF